MAANVSTQKLVNELEKAVKSSDELLLVFKKTNDLVIEMAKGLKDGFKSVDKSTSKGLADFNKLLKETNKLTEDKEKLDALVAKTGQERAKQLQQLNKARAERLKASQEEEKLETQRNKTKQESVKIDQERAKQLQELNKASAERLKGLKIEESIRQQKLKTAIIERKEVERLAIQDEKNRKAKVKLNSEYSQLTTEASKLKREYKDLVSSEGKLTKESRKLLREFKKLDKQIRDIDESAGDFQRNVGNYPGTFSDALGSVKKFTVGILALGGALKGVETGLSATEEGSEDLRKVTNAVSTTWEQAKNTAGTFALDLINVSKKLIENAKDVNGLSDAVDNVANGFEKTSKNAETFAERLDKNIDAGQKATQQIIDLEKAIRPLNERVAILNGIFEKQNAIAGDSTKSFDEIEEAATRASKASVERAFIQQNIAQKELNIINDLINARADDANNIELLNQKSEAKIKLTETLNALDVEQLELQKLIAENTRDRFERELDFAIDAFDTIKTVNERIIADEKTSLEVRRALFEETTALTNKSFESQKALFAEFVSDKIDFEKLSLESDEAVIRSTLRRLDLDDIELGRALEVIRERKIAIQDLSEANDDLIESEQERLDLQRDIEATDIAIVKRTLEATEDLEDDRVNIQLKGIEERLENVEVGSVEELRLLKEKNDLILEQQQKQIEAEKTAQEKADENDDVRTAKRLEARQKLIEDSVKVFDEILSRSRDKQNSELDDEIKGIDSRIDSVRSAIDSGNTEAQSSLAELEEQKIQAEAKKEELRKKEIRDQKIIAGLQVLASNNGDVGKTLGDVSLLIAGLANLPSFFDGTENTGTVNNPLDGNGGRHAIIHDNERILTAKQNAPILDAGLSNDDVSDLVRMHGNGSLNGGTTIIQQNNKELIAEVREMTRAVKNQKTQAYNYNANGKYHEQHIQSMNKKEVIKVRASNIFK